MAREAHHTHRTLTILLGVRNNLSQAQITAMLPVNRSNATRRFHVLETHNYIKRRAKGKPQFWELTAEGKAVLDALLEVYGAAPSEADAVAFRWHAVQVLFRYLAKPPAFERQLSKGGFILSRRATYSGYEAKLDGCTVFCSPLSIWVMLRQPAATPIKAVTAGLRRAFAIRDMLEQKFPGLKLDGDARLTRQHFAMEGGLSLTLPDDFKYRSERLMVDASTGKVEVEAIHSKLAHEDMVQLTELLEFVVREPKALGALKYLVAQGYGDAPAQDAKQRSLEGYA